MARILILAAMAEEAAALYPDHLSIADPRSGFDGRSVQANGHDVIIVTTGLGKVNAALAAGVYGPDAEIFLMIGTCGALDAAAGPYWISEAVQHDYGAATASEFIHYRAGDWPMGQAGPLKFAAMTGKPLHLPHAHIASGDHFMADPVAAKAMQQKLDVQLVDMEVAAVAQAAVKMGKPWAAIKAVSDDANEDSGGDFHKNLKIAARQSAEAMERLIAML